MHITFIVPDWERVSRLYSSVHRKLGGRMNHYANLSVPALAALTAGLADMDVIHELYEELNYDINTDIVAISFFTPQAVRAYEIADEYRRRGIYTIAGGIHPSMLPDEASLHFDTVVTGEAELVWQTVLEDFKKGRIRRKYTGIAVESFENIPPPMREIFNKYQVKAIQPVQTSRGCYFKACNNCVIPHVYGRKIRLKPVDLVVDEIRNIKDKVLYFGDDHLIWGNLSYGAELMDAIKPLGKYFMISGAPLAFAGNSAILKKAYEAGCRMAYVSLGYDPETNRGMFRNYEKLVSRLLSIREAGILPVVSFVYGLDDDGEDVFRKTRDFCKDAKIEIAEFSIQAPFPGTELFSKLSRDGRILHTDWSKYNYMHAVYSPVKLTPVQLEHGFEALWTYYGSEDFCLNFSALFKEIYDTLSPHISIAPNMNS